MFPHRLAFAECTMAYDNIVDHCCEAWNKLIDQPWHIMTIGLNRPGFPGGIFN